MASLKTQNVCCTLLLVAAFIEPWAAAQGLCNSENNTALCSTSCSFEAALVVDNPERTGIEFFVVMIISSLLVAVFAASEMGVSFCSKSGPVGKTNDIVPKTADDKVSATETRTEDLSPAMLRANYEKELGVFTLKFKVEERVGQDTGDQKYVESEFLDYAKKMHMHDVRSRIGTLLLPITTASTLVASFYMQMKTDACDGMDKDYVAVLAFYFVSVKSI